MIHIEEKVKEETVIRIYNYLVQKYECNVVFFADSLFNDIDMIGKNLKKHNSAFHIQEISDIRKTIEYNVISERDLRIGVKNFSHYTEDAWVRFYIGDSIVHIGQLLDEGAELVCESGYERELILLLKDQM